MHVHASYSACAALCRSTASPLAFPCAICVETHNGRLQQCQAVQRWQPAPFLHTIALKQLCSLHLCRAAQPGTNASMEQL